MNFNDSYYFQEPYVSKAQISCLTTEEIITNYAYSLEEFDIQKLNEYADKMHIKRMSNYIAFIIECSDDYVLVEQGILKKKSLLDILFSILIPPINLSSHVYLKLFFATDINTKYTSCQLVFIMI